MDYRGSIGRRGQRGSSKEAPPGFVETKIGGQMLAMRFTPATVAVTAAGKAGMAEKQTQDDGESTDEAIHVRVDYIMKLQDARQAETYLHAPIVQIPRGNHGQ